MTARRAWTCGVALLVLAALAVLAAGYANATADPVVRRLTVRAAGYPNGAAPLRILLFSDLHVHGPDMPPSRVGRIVDRINALHPDVVVAARDFIGNSLVGRHYSPAEGIAPLARLKARYGIYAVLGNNDYVVGAGQIGRELESAGIRVLMDSAVRVGPLALGGLDGRLRSHKALVEARRETNEAVEEVPGVKLLVAHRPDEFVWARKRIGLVLAGHTHCGQIVLPWIGPLETGSDYGRRWDCGLYREAGSLLVVTAGVGTSYVPLRFGAPPDIWLITVDAAPSQP
jgi:predicted MPP superfamily phosphohydrolase